MVIKPPRSRVGRASDMDTDPMGRLNCSFTPDALDMLVDKWNEASIHDEDGNRLEMRIVQWESDSYNRFAGIVELEIERMTNNG